MLSGLIFNEEKIPIYTPSGREWRTPQTAKTGGERMNPGIKILPL